MFGLGIGLNRLKDQKGSAILVYHGIDHVGQTDINARFVSKEVFEKQIRFLKTYCNILSLSDYYEKRFDPDRFNVAITFDDGYLNNLTLALPILERYEAHAAIFVTGIQETDYPCLWADYLDLATYRSNEAIEVEGEVYVKKRGEYYNKNSIRLKSICKQNDWQFKQQIYSALPGNFLDENELKVYWHLADNNQIRQLDASPFITIGSHGYYHDDLGVIPFEQACNNLLKSKTYLEVVLGRLVDALAYPDASYSREVADYARSIGFTKQLACDFLFEEDRNDPALRERLVVNPFISTENQMLAMYQGKY